MSTVGELILEKKINFTNFLFEILENEEVIKHITSEELEKFKTNIEKIRDVSIVLFIFFITKDIMPHRNNLDEFINKFLVMIGIKEDSFFLDDEKLKDYPSILSEYKVKTKKYLNLFIEIMEYSFE